MTQQKKPGQQPNTEQHAGQPPKSGQQQRAGQQQNEGEGNRTAARAYNADQHRFAEDKDKVDKAAKSAERAVDGPEGASLRQAEKEGRKHARD